jgi:hypothetical protein
MDFPTLPYALIFSITGIAVELDVLMVANDRGTECCCCWIVVNLWIVVSRCGSLWLVLGRCGSLWLVPCFSNYDIEKQDKPINKQTNKQTEDKERQD